MIAGISGKLPESENLQEFWDNLIGGVDMVTDDDRRWKAGEWLPSPARWPPVRPPFSAGGQGARGRRGPRVRGQTPAGSSPGKLV